MKHKCKKMFSHMKTYEVRIVRSHGLVSSLTGISMCFVVLHLDAPNCALLFAFVREYITLVGQNFMPKVCQSSKVLEIETPGTCLLFREPPRKQNKAEQKVPTGNSSHVDEK